MENFPNKYTPVISKMAKINTNIIITGDFNIDLLQMNERDKFQKYFDLFVTNGLFPLITLPTRSTKQSSSLIEQMFCKVKRTGDVVYSGILRTDLSDHYPYFAILDICENVKYQPKYITLNAWNEEALFCNEIATSMIEWDMESDLFADPNDNNDHFEKIIQDAKTKYLQKERNLRNTSINLPLGNVWHPKLSKRQICASSAPGSHPKRGLEL